MPSPDLLEPEEEEEEQPAETPDEEIDTMPEDTDPEPEEEEQNVEEEDVEEEEEEPEVAEVDMPDEEDGDLDVKEGEESDGGVLSSIPTKAIIVVAAAIIGGVLLLWFLRGNQNATEPVSQEEMQERPEDQMGVTAGDGQPLKQDEQTMNALGMGSGQ